MERNSITIEQEMAADKSRDRALLAGLSERLSEEMNANVLLRRENTQLQAEMALRDAAIHLHEKTISELTAFVAELHSSVHERDAHPPRKRKRTWSSTKGKSSNLTHTPQEELYNGALKVVASQPQRDTAVGTGMSSEPIWIKQEPVVFHSPAIMPTSASADDGETELNRQEILNQSHVSPKFACQLCLKKFERKIDLKNHAIGAHGFLPENCPFCEARFPGKPSLHEHMQTAHSKLISPEGCPYCEKRFAGKSNLRQHMRMVHNIK